MTLRPRKSEKNRDFAYFWGCGLRVPRIPQKGPEGPILRVHGPLEEVPV